MKTCRASIGRYDDNCGLPEGHDGPCLDEFTVQLLAKPRRNEPDLCGALCVPTARDHCHYLAGHEGPHR
jgi:hypothetical protein